MTRDACFKMAGITGKEFGARVTFTVGYMEQSIQSLREGHKTAGHSDMVSDRLEAFAGQWQTLSAALQQVSAGDYHSVPVQQILQLEPALHSELSEIHAVYAAERPKDHTDAVLAKKMQIHKLIKEACFVLRGISTEKYTRYLNASVTEFGEALNMAHRHFEPETVQALDGTWQEMKELLTELVAADKVSDVHKIRLSSLSDEMIAKLSAML
ncbi:hypothetical protein [uncultured Roseobacter sp.]|uniref:hypothetical protein n=1 Tax=uncultured Roseobacter sp. TaxID=114847 RepID=UPI00262DDC7D|nr:hypothetical protein [uncultured Roseobacter sp.]